MAATAGADSGRSGADWMRGRGREKKRGSENPSAAGPQHRVWINPASGEEALYVEEVAVALMKNLEERQMRNALKRMEALQDSMMTWSEEANTCSMQHAARSFGQAASCVSEAC